ncbi:hypothetical protein [Holospora undulata]|uniref:Uncharacterized protein n=1 Tax=Holospora undulata HU1 TaxID=1321371 RepID=A0A061JI75_9PROT|nr:hypothetical protein [Holospora undulata]ETZ05272.1 hypothetical protein K737_300292 [Holospora undulata HU1]
MEFKLYQSKNWKIGFSIFGMISSCFANLPDITLAPFAPTAPITPEASPASPDLGASPASPNPSATPAQEKVIDPPVPENRIEKYYSTSFADHFGPSPWVISSTP